MKCLSVQIQPERSPDLDNESFIDLFKKWCGKSTCVSGVDVDEGFDDGGYINTNCMTSDLGALWSQIRSRFYEGGDSSPGLPKASIVVCEGEHGWDDYLLLHHLDDTEELDTI
ncbi:MAG: hypothetical protein H8E73_04515 [Planctomycetes bacterium]|nr:hypothetical protein [Planctomycetota bacterium]MBL7185631.1 hypothetical protein [Phycisphaerae bacterium]